MTTPELLTTAQASKILDTTPRTVARMVEDERLAYALKLPGETGMFLFDPAVIEQARLDLVAELTARLERLNAAALTSAS